MCNITFSEYDNNDTDDMLAVICSWEIYADGWNLFRSF